MQIVLSALLPEVPRAAAIWLSLLAVAAVAVATLLLRPGRHRFDVASQIRRAALPSDPDRAAEERELSRYAEEVAVAAERAAATARRLRAQWLTAQEMVESAWSACEEAEAGVRRLSAAAAMPLPHTGRSPAEYAERERFLHRAALTAYWRRELSVEQLSAVFAHQDGWDPRLHPVEQELVLRRAVRDNMATRHRAAQEQEQAAWQAAERAAESARTLRVEAHSATSRRPEELPSVLALVGVSEPTAEQTREIPAVPAARGRAAVPAY
ncbi:hypothetical protein QTQ03_22795 [Micromonospora sp. WMMA1363]|uniref:hypothetical protein n=1 Tax=Micromonospora sp. WMMA1363 TaxID=3053985 RepID=UPI00259D067D|nr:hypothetical protein [Micromonospora sp. WMMA1363]MDM4722277.1 hypothetical protein [Micromonospora sp. WMMA1363]